MKKAYRIVTVLMLTIIAAFSFSGCAYIKSKLFGNKKSGNIQPHLISEQEAEEEPVRPISAYSMRALTSTAEREQLDELLDIVYAGKEERPDINAAEKLVRDVYDAAVGVLNRYVKNDYTQLQRVHAIHDWLAYNVQYDFDLLANYDNADRDDPSFGLDGVFLNKKAVCDGFSKAFCLLCGIEGIKCVRITGRYNNEGSSLNHAWNKVCIDGVWYNVDASMDVWHVYTDDSTRADLLNHGYFLISDAAISDKLTGRHTESGTDPVNFSCTQNYDIHSKVACGVKDYVSEVTTQEQLNAVFKAIKNSKRSIGKVELKLNFPEYAAENLSNQNAYVTQIRVAYQQVSDADFIFNPSTGNYPYMRYPNGVFVFLIYK